MHFGHNRESVGIIKNNFKTSSFITLRSYRKKRRWDRTSVYLKHLLESCRNCITMYFRSYLSQICLILAFKYIVIIVLKDFSGERINRSLYNDKIKNPLIIYHTYTYVLLLD